MSNGREAGASGGSVVYGLGLIGAIVYFFQDADGFWEYVLGAFKAIVWPALLVYEAFGALAG